MRYPRLYSALKRHGHTPCKAVEILLEASRGDKFALLWCRKIRLVARENKIAWGSGYQQGQALASAWPRIL